jgi:Heparinase II/III-like protein/Heparinase II/III N-terminus
MRSAKEISFRLQQEIANAVLLFAREHRELHARAPLELLPSPKAVGNIVRDTSYAVDLVKLADQILLGKIPIFDSELDYGPSVAWRRDPVRGTETPRKYFRFIPYLDLGAAGDHKWIWEVNRHQHLVLLAQAFVVTGKQLYCDEVIRQLESWWDDNPPQRGINWTSALEVGFRALSWIWIWHLLGENMSPEFRQRFLTKIYDHGLHLQYNLSIYFSPNTHLLGEAVALHALGRLFPEFPRAQHWRTLGRDIVRAQMKAQVRQDGSHFEQSTYYHMYALDFFLLHAVLEDVSDEYRDGLVKMTDFLASVVRSDGELPLLGDDDGGRVFHPYGKRAQFGRGTLATASLILGQASGSYSARDVEEVALWWLGPEKSRRNEGSQVARQSQVFRNSGLVAMKRGNVSALFDAGPFGPWSAGHSHADTLSLIVSVGAQDILIDPGTYSYLDPQWRETFRGTAAHNTICIDGKDQATPAGPFRWLDKPEVSLIEFSSTAEQDSSTAICRYRGFTHKRTVKLVNDGQLEISDDLDGPPGEHLVEQFWHLGRPVQQTGPDVWRIGELAELLVADGQNEQGWRSSVFGSKEISPVIVVRRRVTLPARFHAELRLVKTS